MTTDVDVTAPVLEVLDITKSYGTNQVLRGISLQIEPGTIYGLMGANGAGKSTLIKVLSGAESHDGGTITLGGREMTFADPLAASRAGIGTVHQNPNDGVILDMTVAENLALDQLADRRGSVIATRRATEARAREVAATLGLNLSKSVLRARVHELGVSERQLLVLARALSRSPELLILDEPTSALSAEETARLFDLVRDQVAGGMTVLYVSHKLAEFDVLCDRVGVLRDGKMRGEFTKNTAEGDEKSGTFDWPVVLQALFDRSPADMQRTEQRGDEAILELHDVRVLAESEPVDLAINRGEVTVLLGLLGSGKTELLEWATGARPALSGSMTLDGKPFAPHHPAQAHDAGVYLVPESRHEQAIIPTWSLAQQMTLPYTERFSVGTLMRRGKERAAAREMMNRLGVVARGPRAAIETLSGGNQQKVVIGKFLLGEPRVLLLDEPFRGVDIHARHDIAETIRTLTVDGAVLVATSDLDEAFEVADRIIVFRQGSIAADVRLHEASRTELIAAMSQRTSTLIDETDLPENTAGEFVDPLESLVTASEEDTHTDRTDPPATSLRKDQ